MKTIKEAAREYAIKNCMACDGQDDYKNLISEDVKAFIAGVQFAESWISVTEELPKKGIEILLQNDHWINEDFNPKGERFGFLSDLGWHSVYFCNNCDEYHTRVSFEDDPVHFEDFKGENQIPTKWRPINRK